MSSDDNPDSLIEFKKRAIARELWPCCLNCDYFDEKAELCTKAKARPPAQIIVLGCNLWTPLIPF